MHTGNLCYSKYDYEVTNTRICVRRLAQRQARHAKGKRENRYVIKVMNGEEKEGRDSWARKNQRFNLTFLLVQ